jgi:hypothetical protein
MGLKSDIEAAFINSTLADDPGTEEHGGGDTTKISELAQDLTDAIINWVTAQTFTITEMKASLELEDFKCIAPGAIQIMPGIPTAGSPAAQITTGPGSSSPINLSKGIMISTGHAYVGMPATKVPGGDTKDEWNTYTKVKLDPNKVKNK